MSRAQLTASLAATVTLMLSACGGSASEGGKGAPAGPIGTDTDLAALCDRACENAQSGACNNTNPDCAADCKASLDEFPKLCNAEVKAVFSCYAEQTVVCGGDQAPSFPQCASTVVALGKCVQAHVEADPTYGGRCLPGSSTPENSETYCGALSDTPLLYECTGGAPRAGCVAEPTGGEHLYCCPEL